MLVFTEISTCGKGYTPSTNFLTVSENFHESYFEDWIAPSPVGILRKFSHFSFDTVLYFYSIIVIFVTYYYLLLSNKVKSMRQIYKFEK